ncbi:DUF72 domain-containing protein [Pedobacter sp. SYSU D00535]|uniref:DUF72 domain-containing protein n=1 Tax=Pedobacter sp. SYSU D00535 TaxID=2810308 RepID=UPI001A96853D|nr:DUF72 domain-containing protein [Pedobacter sp. SYSU D00535]
MTDWYVGCSGFHYKHWRGTFYPEKLPSTKWFDYYCQHFNTLELNVTFYRFPRLPAMKNWHDISPANFQFAVKVPKAITHFKQFNGVTGMLSDFYRTTREGLQDKLGCVLFQMSPRFIYKEERLEKILSNLDNSFLNVLEFRHPSWWNDTVYQALASNNISFCGMSHPELPREAIINTPLFYYRFHGENELYGSNYPQEQLKDFAQSITARTEIQKAFIFFNNDINTFAPINALHLKSLMPG